MKSEPNSSEASTLPENPGSLRDLLRGMVTNEVTNPGSFPIRLGAHYQKKELGGNEDERLPDHSGSLRARDLPRR